MSRRLKLGVLATPEGILAGRMLAAMLEAGVTVDAVLLDPTPVSERERAVHEQRTGERLLPLPLAALERHRLPCFFVTDHNSPAALDLIAALGLRDQVVVATRDVVMILPRERSKEIKRLVDRVAAAGRNEHSLHPLVHRPWGTYEGIDDGDGYQVKRIVVKPGGRLSLQRHSRRAEHWIVVRGLARVTIDERVFELGANQSTHVPLGSVHRLENSGSEPLYMIEVQCGDYLGEDDIERLEDVYNRS